MKIIQVTKKIYQTLINKSKQSYNYLINSSIEKNRINEEFDEEEAQYYNECVEKLNNGDYSDTYQVDIDDLDEKLEELESEGMI